MPCAFRGARYCLSNTNTRSYSGRHSMTFRSPHCRSKANGSSTHHATREAPVFSQARKRRRSQNLAFQYQHHIWTKFARRTKKRPADSKPSPMPVRRPHPYWGDFPLASHADGKPLAPATHTLRYTGPDVVEDVDSAAQLPETPGSRFRPSRHPFRTDEQNPRSSSHVITPLRRVPSWF